MWSIVLYKIYSKTYIYRETQHGLKNKQAFLFHTIYLTTLPSIPTIPTYIADQCMHANIFYSVLLINIL